MTNSIKNETISCRVSEQLVEELEKYGKKTTVGGRVIEKFYQLLKFEKTLPKNGVITSLDCAHVYVTPINPKQINLNVKRNDQEMIIELNHEQAAHIIQGFIGLINQE
jgi:hypothetical protein